MPGPQSAHCDFFEAIEADIFFVRRSCECSFRAVNVFHSAARVGAIWRLLFSGWNFGAAEGAP